MIRIALVVVATAASGCIPIKASTECQARVNECLRNCTPPPTAGAAAQLSDDSRTPCERDCELRCN